MALDAFRADLANYTREMKAVAGLVGAPSNLSVALREIPSLSNEELATLHAAFSANPAWKDIPRTLRSLVEEHRPPTAGTALFADDCEGARSWSFTQTDAEIAADVATLADAILEAVPQDTLSAGGRILAVVIWAVPQAALRTVEHNYNIAQSCDDSDFQAGVNTRLDGIAASLAALQGPSDDAIQRLKSVQAVQRQILRLELTPAGRRAVTPQVLTCTGDDCPSVLACPGPECRFPLK